MGNDEDLTYIGLSNWREGRPLFGIKRRDRRQHVYVVGKSGTGKSTALLTMILQDVKFGHGVAVADPHGDLAEQVLDYIPAWRINDVVYFNPADYEHPIGFNVLEIVPPAHPDFPLEKALVSSGVLAVFKKIWGASWGPRLEHILRNSILALLDSPGSTLLGVPRLLHDESFRAVVVRRIRDPVVRAFWEDEFLQYGKNFRTEALAPIENKVGHFLSSSLIRNIVAQARSTLRFKDVLEGQKILVMNLSKGRIGEDTSALLGAMMITKLQLAAMERARQPQSERRDFYLYVDEFQSFATDAFEGILSESRKYGLSITAGHQYLAQLPESLRDAVLGNVGTMIAFRLGALDARALEPEFEPQFRQHDLVALENHRACIKMAVDGAPALPFSMSTVVPDHPSLYEGHRDKVIRVSRERYARPKQQVEEKIARWTNASGRSDAVMGPLPR